MLYLQRLLRLVIKKIKLKKHNFYYKLKIDIKLI
jgi:hypothetical protein